ncbi:MAG: glycosyl hydrolase [Gemmatimonadetes bacterium]|uniref:Glycosyl hydrolase n=1 Tax=Candidatus Kutchimonas denitrificans TaxID=3056748 RepID=A0AAE4Z6S1_9BACT|nr:glycosyl hydrolase [Gemmatimonadota bacterium]NIR74053.1 glycosyl hydrolase [Candidatus Kutchimonas denitrificans]NIS01615.1 glycosyl hydrolase [Gemmatimonadota bacterium]NIT67353.1 glycosyl hydrolase [Gemmatimonadota bacterium]NIU52716.1 glycosyl hydrolase [Gemmatimonadota bacterium]
MPAEIAQAQQNRVYDTAVYSAMEYRMVGPYRGGRSTAVTGIAEKPFTYFMGSTGGGVWKTTNAGESWENVTDGFFGGSIGAIDVANSDPNVIYVGTGSACIRGNTSTGRGVYKSTDGGASWTFSGLPEAGQIGDLVVHPTNPDLVYLAALGHPFGNNAERGVFRSRDGGASWEKVLFISDSTGAVSLAMNPANPRVIFAGMWRAERKPWTAISGAMEGGVYKTTDGGDTWARVKGGLPQGVVGKTAVAVSPANPDRVWALIEAEGDEGGLYRSDDGGEKWSRVNGDRSLRQRAWYYTHLYADPIDENTVYVLNVRFQKSIDGGKSFDAVSVPHGDVHDLWLNPRDPSHMVVGNDGGAQVTLTGGATWTTYYNQPTAEFYSVTVDDGFPYRLYAPQQDNSTISVPAWNSGGISPKQFWHYVGGCETGPVALNPDRPEIIYSGCYGGSITRYDRERDHFRSILLYPQLQLGQAPRDLKYRFQWNAPIVVSPHDPDVVYHASQYVHRTTDGGQTWETISPDLTTDMPEHQDYAGEPITKDNTGVEVFNTIFTLRVSPHSPDVLWAGSDDGRVHVSRDGGATWNDVTPNDMPRFGTVDAIDVSPHDPATAYMAVHRYRLDDFAPYIFKTENYGDSWRLLTDGRNGIPGDHPTRVVREDPDRAGLLYAGTEFGLFVSFDDGRHWQTFQQNLPITPVTDLVVHRKDLVVATQGRSLWIMDDLSPLHQLGQQVADAEAHLFAPRDAYRASVSRRRSGRWPEGPPGGATIYYYLADAPDGVITLEILDAEGDVIQTFTSDSAKAREAGTRALSAEAGLNRFVWNLRYPDVDEVKDAITWGFTAGPAAMPGSYQVRLTASAPQTQPFQVLKNPNYDHVTPADLEAQFELSIQVRDRINELYDAVRDLRSVRDQVSSTAKLAVEAGHAEDIKESAKSISEKLTEVEKQLMQTRNESRQDPLNFPPMLDNQYVYLYGHIQGDHRPNEGAYERFADLNAQWEALSATLQEIIDTDVAAFNVMLRERGVPGIIVPGVKGETVSASGESES